MTSLFHKFKKKVAGHQEDTAAGPLCPEYDLTKVDFEGLHDAMIRLRQQLLTYRESNGRLWLSSAAISTDFAQQLEMDQSHPYTAMAATFKSSHSQLPTDRERLDTMLSACLLPLKEQLQRMDELRERMQQHDRLKDEVVYYQGKVDALKKTRETNKKVESAADKEKYERNVKKLQDQEAAFRSADAQLVAELRHIYAHRVAVLGPIMLAFVVAEKQVVASYSAAISQVQLVDVNEANAWLAKHEQEFAAKQQLDVSRTTTATVTDLQSPRAPVVVTTTTEHQRVSSAVSPDLLSPAAMTAVSGVTPLTTSGVTVSEPVVSGNPSLRQHYGADYGATSPTAASGAVTPFSPTAADWMSNLPPPTSSTAASATDSSAASSYPSAFDSTPYTMGSTASYSASSASHANGTATAGSSVTSVASSSSSSSSSAASPLIDLDLVSPSGQGPMDADANSKVADAAAPAASKDSGLDGFDKPASSNPPTLI